MQKVVVIVPVYNAFEETIACLRSVAQCSPADQRVLVLDDASPMGVLESELPADLLRDHRFEVLRNAKNLGFVRNCNRGMELAGAEDVILLNSDTIVSSGWVEKLQAAAYMRPEIGTVTPFTNKGTIVSLTQFGVDNELPCGMNVAQFAALVESVSEREYPELPTCIGHCVYIKRELIRAVGFFDYEHFGHGYGEENDFSCRAIAAGYSNVLDDATFIYHMRNASFQGWREALMDENSATLRRLHPHYFDRVARFCRSGRLDSVRKRVLDEVVVHWNSGRRRVLHVLHNGPFEVRGDPLGGTERTVQDIINGASGKEAHWSLVAIQGGYVLTAHFPEGSREYLLNSKSVELKSILRPEFFDLIHLHHSRWLDHQELCAALIAHAHYVVSLHDYVLVCPRFHLLPPTRVTCGGHGCSESCGYAREYIQSYRSATQEIFAKARRLIYFSNSTKQIMETIIPGSYRWELLPHGIKSYLSPSVRKHVLPAQVSDNSPLKVLVLGAVPPHKGSLIVGEVLRRLQNEATQRIEWHVLGKLHLDHNYQLTDHGEYEPEEVCSKIQEIAPHVVVILSIWPETYCLTLDEAWNAGVPVVVTPLGAIAERVRASGAGWVLKEASADELLRQLNDIYQDWSNYCTVWQKVGAVRLRSVSEGTIAEMYGHLLSGRGVNNEQPLLEFLTQNECDRLPSGSLIWRIVGKVTSVVIYVIDGLGIRSQIEKLAYGLVPKGILDKLKRVR